MSLKRKRSKEESAELDLSGEDFLGSVADVSDALPTKQPTHEEQDTDDDHEFRRFLAERIARRDVKAGTEILKKSTKGGKRTKGEVGGGSFQSMGQYCDNDPRLYCD